MDSAKAQVDKVKGLLSLNGRRLFLDTFTGMGNLVNDINKAHEKAKLMTETFNQAKGYSDNFNQAYSTLMNLAK